MTLDKPMLVQVENLCLVIGGSQHVKGERGRQKRGKRHKTEVSALWADSHRSHSLTLPAFLSDFGRENKVQGSA